VHASRRRLITEVVCQTGTSDLKGELGPRFGGGRGQPDDVRGRRFLSPSVVQDPERMSEILVGLPRGDRARDQGRWAVLEWLEEP